MLSMNQNILAPDEGAPPRTVYEWTTVIGHNVTITTGPPARCACGEQQHRASTLRPHEWREEHVRTAWPILVDRLQEEPLGDWHRRLITVLEDAYRAVEELDERLGLGEPIRQGEPYPVADDESVAAYQRVLVLEHQLEEVRRRSRSTSAVE